MKARVKAIYPSYVTMALLLNGVEVGEHHVVYTNIKITDIAVGQMFDVVEDKFGGLNFWREGQ